MPRWLTVSSHRLRGRALEIDDARRVEKATLFPFFDDDGIVQRVMVADEQSPDILILDPSGAAVYVVWLGPVQVSSDSRFVNTLADDDVEQLVQWRHFDPWWVLGEDRFHDHPAVPFLKATNCADAFLKQTTKLRYTRDLKQAVFAVQPSSDGTNLVRWRSDLLSPNEMTPVPQITSKRRQWKLAPFWIAADSARTPEIDLQKGQKN